ncbi:anthranilate synthase family protein [Agromyces cerinus]|uniref:anthranilate synthase n=1 Tax=Agromyces cerinus subsp. cerinus TaxID=232089 RepID=A0A1N6HP85_9MICO|nr:anthranilate synthase family protein [Agromyces cerinus]SIO21499.1 phenazine biosynthesis protein phzE [Agromyces cerinus subsp. cerinus]
MTRLLAALLATAVPAPFAVVRREHEPTLDVLVGDVVDVELLADIPLDGAEVLALVPFRQVRERGFIAHDDGAPLRCLIVRDRETIDLDEAIGLLPEHPIAVDDLAVDVSDAEYAARVRRVIDEEIGRGEGANFVIRREFTGRIEASAAHAVLGWLRALLEHEVGAYWTFAVHTPGLSVVGATPERHVSSIDGLVSMNPISGTFRHLAGPPADDELVAFLDDVKEREELVMVVDEELKMMSAVCPDGGRIRGPFLKRMSRLTHTEYLLEGRSDRDPRDVLRLTMFAPTVTGSPMGNACTVIARHESTARGYYAGVLARFTPTADGYDLDAPILIRTAYVDAVGGVRVPVGATLVRHSNPDGEVAETHAKAAGVLTALGAIPGAGTAAVAPPSPGSNGSDRDRENDRIATLLDSRNDHLAPFWSTPQAAHRSRGASALVIDAGDDFTTMLAHQLRHLGVDARVVPWNDAAPEASADLVVFGPGPGDPRDEADARVARLRELMTRRLASGAPMLAVCLSHQVLAMLAGLPIAPLPAPRQGVQLDVDLFGEPAAIGFYNTFGAMAADRSITPHLDLEVAADAATGVVHALRGPRVASVQGHLESVLSPDGLRVLERIVDGLLEPGPAELPAVERGGTPSGA